MSDASPAFVRVVLDQSAGKPLDYGVPAGVTVGVGSRVRVPLRTRLVLGTVVSVHATTEARGVRDLAEVVGNSPLIGPVLLRMASWMADYYCCPDEVATRAVLPVVIRKAEVGHKKRDFATIVREPTAEELGGIRKKAPRQAEAFEALRAEGGKLAVASVPDLRDALKGLVRRGWVEIALETVARDPEGEFLPSPKLELNPEQVTALATTVAAIDAPDIARPILLHGVTGSGKTEVYLQAIAHALELGKTALVMVPEISLTPQTVERFKSRFAEMQAEVAVMHSHLSEGERHDEWHKIHSGRAKIVIGARSAVFAPLGNLGLIVVDEEHESSYKQEEAPRYQGRDLAVMRGSLEPCAVLLGSATPSMESYHNATTGKYELLSMPSRIDDRSMPLIRVVDMRQQNRVKGQPTMLSPILSAGIEGRLALGQQVILFLNRRGYASALICNVCGHVCNCPDCSVALTVHRDDERLRCHVCGHAAIVPRKCPGCGDRGIAQAGYGTQRIEEVVRRFYPKARVARMDADAMARKGSFRATLDEFKAGKIDILIGTQMIAKGLHFPNVTLVGIVNADMSLHVSDFRSGERTFQLLTQVAGRAGRGDYEGEVVVQTFTPASPAIQYARHHDFAGFWEQESEFRERFQHPPFLRLVLVTVRGEQEEMTDFCAQTLERKLREAAPPEWIIGSAVPAPLARAKTLYRFQVTIRGASAVRISRLLRELIGSLSMPDGVRAVVDVDAGNLG
ncbi:MAG: primosomal protein N' [Chthoniobacterales bacterium]